MAMTMADTRDDLPCIPEPQSDYVSEHLRLTGTAVGEARRGNCLPRRRDNELRRTAEYPIVED